MVVPPPEFEAAYERASAAITGYLKDLPPDEYNKKIEEMRMVVFRALELDFVSEDEQKAQLRRLGCAADLDNPVEFWRYLWAYAHNAGFTEAQFWRLSPRDLYAVLESKAAAQVQPLLKPARQLSRRARRRAWFAQKLLEGWTRKDLKGKLDSKTIGRYLSGKTSRRDAYVRGELARAFKCGNIDDVPE